MSDYRTRHSRAFIPTFYPCPWCEGKGITMSIFHADLPGGIHLVCYDLVDRPCGQCQGTGEVSAEKYAQMTEE